MTYIATLSGGKDSTAMLDLLLRDKKPLDHIVFYDTLHEFAAMYEYIAKLGEYFKARYGKEITILKPAMSFEECVFGRISRGENRGAIRALPAPQTQGFCAWRREAKVAPFERWLKAQNFDEYKIYIGYTTDETRRRMDGNEFLYPLVDDYDMSEADCTIYLKEREMENPLYRFFSRTGCYFCPAQSKRAFYQVWKNFKPEWEYMKRIEAELLTLQDSGEHVLNTSWFAGNLTCTDMEAEFARLSRQGSLAFDDEPLKDCFCKI